MTNPSASEVLRLIAEWMEALVMFEQAAEAYKADPTLAKRNRRDAALRAHDGALYNLRSVAPPAHLSALATRHEQIEAALEWYGDESNYEVSIDSLDCAIESDRGARARALRTPPEGHREGRP